MLETETERGGGGGGEQAETMLELGIIRTELGELLRENAALPSEERLVLQAFLLDEAACQMALVASESQLAVERGAMEARCVMQRHATQAVLHACWHHMQVQGRCIKALGATCALAVRNFAVALDAAGAEAEQLQLEVARHELLLSVTRLITFKPWQTMTDSELEQRLNASPLDRRSFKSVAEGVQRLLGDLWLAQARVGAGPVDHVVTEEGTSDSRERAVQSGSATHSLLTPDVSPALSLVMPFQQMELNISTHEASKHAIILTSVIKDLKELFNTEFNELWLVKENELLKYDEIYERLREIGKELNEEICEDEYVLSTWDSSEKPELIIIEQEMQEGEGEEGAASCSDHSAKSAPSFCGRALVAMMDDRVEVRWQERLAMDPAPPACMASKSAGAWTEEERCSVESYERQLANVRGDRESYRTQLLQEKAQLRAALKDGSQRFDASLARLARRRLDVEAAVHQEELKVARIRLWSLTRAHMLQRERHIRQQLGTSDDKLERLRAQRQRLQVRCDAKKKHHEALLAQDRQQARGFRREFTQLSPMVVDQLAKIYKRRPPVQLSAAQLRFMSCKLGAPQHSGNHEALPSSSGDAAAAPPSIEETASPDKAETASPLTVAPPATTETAPLVPVETAPPATVETAPPATVETAPPAIVETVPPVTADTVPPATVEAAPPQKGLHPTVDPVTEPCRMFMATLRVMDATTNASPSVDTTAWSALCRLRRLKVEAEIKVKASALEVAETDAALMALDVRIETECRRQQELTGRLDEALDHKRRLLLDTEVQLLLPRGQIELASVASVSGCEEAVVVSLDCVRALNRDIREAGARKLAALRVGLRFRACALRHAEWELLRADAQAQLLVEELAHADKITITAEIRQFLQGVQPKATATAAAKKTYDQQLLRRRAEDLQMEISALRRQRNQMERENIELDNQITRTESELPVLRQTIPLGHQNYQHRLLVEQSRLQRTIRAEGEQLWALQRELDKMKLRTFPTLFDVSF